MFIFGEKEKKMFFDIDEDPIFIGLYLKHGTVFFQFLLIQLQSVVSDFHLIPLRFRSVCYISQIMPKDVLNGC